MFFFVKFTQFDDVFKKAKPFDFVDLSWKTCIVVVFLVAQYTPFWSSAIRIYDCNPKWLQFSLNISRLEN